MTLGAKIGILLYCMEGSALIVGVGMNMVVVSVGHQRLDIC